MYNFKDMKIGDKLPCPVGKWGEPQRDALAQAAEFANTQEPRWQFQADGHDGSTFERGQYWIERIR